MINDMHTEHNIVTKGKPTRERMWNDRISRTSDMPHATEQTPSPTTYTNNPMTYHTWPRCETRSRVLVTTTGCLLLLLVALGRLVGLSSEEDHRAEEAVACSRGVLCVHLCVKCASMPNDVRLNALRVPPIWRRKHLHVGRRRPAR